MINKHYCQGELKATSLVFKAKSCHESAKENETRETHAGMPANCPMHQAQTSNTSCEEKKGCCSNESEFVKLNTDQEITSFEFQKIQMPVFVTLLVFGYHINYIEPESTPVHYQNYKPPLIVCDLPVSLQTFLL